MSHPIKIRNFIGVRQAELNWCWVAATASIYNYFAGRSHLRPGHQQQCVFVSDQIIPPPYACRYAPKHPIPHDCLGHRCANPSAAQPDYLSKELDKYGLLDYEVPLDGTTWTFGRRIVYGGFDVQEIRDAIDRRCPVGLRVSTSPVGGMPNFHFLIVIGYHPLPEDRMILWDPAKGEVHATAEEIVGMYGRIQNKYVTRMAKGRKARLQPSKTLSDPASAAPRDWHVARHGRPASPHLHRRLGLDHRVRV
jgi:hypothetical protein